MPLQDCGPHQDWDPSCKIYIGGLRSDSDKYDVEEAFAQYGKVLGIWIARKPPGFGFILMGSHRDAKDACEGLNNSKIGPYRCFLIVFW